MCLDRLKKFKTTGRGWKVYTLARRYRLDGWAIPYKTRGWNIDTKMAPIPARCGNYPTGFHIFTRKSDAMRWKGWDGEEQIAPVQYRKVVATGYQSSMRVVVAREFRFLPLSKRKKQTTKRKH